MKKIILLFFIIIVLSALFFYLRGNDTDILKNNNQVKKERSVCLSNDEVIDYKIEKKNRTLGDIEAVVYINIKNNLTRSNVKNFQLDNIYKSYHPIEIHKCGIYIMKMFNYDFKETKQPFGFKMEIWRYQYNSGTSLILLSEKNKEEISINDFSYDFRVDPTEKYVVLEKGYLGKDNYAVVIKNLETKEDVFTLPMKDIADLNEELIGSFGMNEWSKDGKYYWGNIFDGANVLAFFRIETGTWKMQFFPAPEGTMGGDALNPENGYITYDNGAPWTGDADFNKTYQEQWKKEGKKVSFYLYNLFTKEKILLGTDSDPTSSIKGSWISDKEFEYTLPNSEKRIYKIK